MSTESEKEVQRGELDRIDRALKDFENNSQKEIIDVFPRIK